MVYAKFPWVDESDADYYSFPNLQLCIEYIYREQVTSYMISSEVMDIPEMDYTYVESYTHYED